MKNGTQPVATIEEVATKTDGTPIFNGTGKVAPGDRLYSEAQVEAMRRKLGFTPSQHLTDPTATPQ